MKREAEAAARSIMAFCDACDVFRNDARHVHAFDAAREDAMAACHAFAEALYDVSPMRGDEVNAWRERIRRGVVSVAWAQRATAIGEECGS